MARAQARWHSAVGSLTLANANAETLLQTAKDPPVANLPNCVLCRNPTASSFLKPSPARLPNRLITPGHVLAVGPPYEAANSISGNLLLRP